MAIQFRAWFRTIKSSPNLLRCLTAYKCDVRHNSEAVLIKKALLCEPDTDKSVTVQGWVRAVRQHQDVTFLDINDGSSLKHLQIVIPSSEVPSNVTFGSCVHVDGNLVACPVTASHPSGEQTRASGVPVTASKQKQTVEVKTDNITVIGPCDFLSYPFKARKIHPPDYVRQYLHLRPRTATFGALLRMRNTATMAIHQYFQNEGFCLIQTPIITSNDCEGAGEVFTIQADQDKSGKSDHCDEFFGSPAYLTVSSQLHLEVVAGAFSRVYSFGPTFRAENSRTRTHLSEFTMVESEVGFTRSLHDITKHVEGLLKYTAGHVVASCGPDFMFYLDNISPRNHLRVVEKMLSTPFINMTYTEAIDTLLKHVKEFENPVSWGVDLHKEHERFLVKHCDDVPVFVTDYPADIKPFYAKANADGKTVAAVDLLFPRVGEVCGGSLREDNLELLEGRLSQLRLKEKLDWYLDLRRFGSSPHGGFGVGFERFIQSLLGITNIKDALPFPRSANSCKM